MAGQASQVRAVISLTSVALLLSSAAPATATARPELLRRWLELREVERRAFIDVSEQLSASLSTLRQRFLARLLDYREARNDDQGLGCEVDLF